MSIVREPITAFNIIKLGWIALCSKAKYAAVVSMLLIFIPSLIFNLVTWNISIKAVHFMQESCSETGACVQGFYQQVREVAMAWGLQHFGLAIACSILVGLGYQTLVGLFYHYFLANNWTFKKILGKSLKNTLLKTIPIFVLMMPLFMLSQVLAFFAMYLMIVVTMLPVLIEAKPMNPFKTFFEGLFLSYAQDFKTTRWSIVFHLMGVSGLFFLMFFMGESGLNFLKHLNQSNGVPSFMMEGLAGFGGLNILTLAVEALEPVLITIAMIYLAATTVGLWIRLSESQS